METLYRRALEWLGVTHVQPITTGSGNDRDTASLSSWNTKTVPQETVPAGEEGWLLNILSLKPPSVP